MTPIVKQLLVDMVNNEIQKADHRNTKAIGESDQLAARAFASERGRLREALEQLEGVEVEW